MQTVFCAHCGKEYGKDTTACPGCGKLFPYPDGAAVPRSDEGTSLWLQALAAVGVVIVIGIVGLMVLAVMWFQAIEGAMVAYMLYEDEYSSLPVNEFRIDRPEQQARETPKLLPVNSSPNDWQDHISIDSCAWETEEADGWEALNIAFSVFSESGNQLFANYQVQKSGNGLSALGENASGITLVDGDTARHTFQTTEFQPGAEDLELLITIDRYQDRARYAVPLDQCAWRSTSADGLEIDFAGGQTREKEGVL